MLISETQVEGSSPMPSAFREKNPELHRVVVELRKAEHAHDAPIWGAVADRLERARHQVTPLNVGHLERLAEADDWVVVPGKLLADGPLSKPLTVAALSYSGEARAKVHAAGGKALTISELLKEKPDGSGVRLLA
jgi:large subunit ribosomal protein L18e